MGNTSKATVVNSRFASRRLVNVVRVEYVPDKGFQGLSDIPPPVSFLSLSQNASSSASTSEYYLGRPNATGSRLALRLP